MSWIAHDLEPYLFQRKLGAGVAISFVALVLGSWGPDVVTKWFVYGTNVVGPLSGFVWEALWVAAALACWPILRRSYFRERIAPRDGFWAWSGRLLPEDALLTLYRGAIFFGVYRFATWMHWAHVLHHYPFDLTWGGPHWAPALRL